MKTYTIHGDLSKYYQGTGNPCMDSEGNIFPSAADCARYHQMSPSTMFGAEYIRPVKSKLLGKRICTATIYTSPDIIADPDQTRLAEDLAKYETLFTDYIFKKIPALVHADGTYSLGKKNSAGYWGFDKGFGE